MILFRYLSREVLGMTAFVTVIVLFVAMGWRFGGYLQEAAGGLWTKDVLFLMMAYRLPGFLELIVPISFFLSIMLTYGRLHADSEMTILTACGVGPGRMIAITLQFSLVIIVITAMMALWLKPTGEARLEKIYSSQQNLTELDTLAAGRFQNLRSGGRVMYTESLSKQGKLQNVFINEFREGGVLAPKTGITIVATDGESVVDGSGGRFLLLRDGVRYSGVAGNKDYRMIKYAEYGQRIEREDRSYQYNWRTAVPTRELLQTPNLANLSELQWRISVILLIPVIAIMAIPLSKVTPRQGKFTRLIPGMFCCFLYVISLSAARSAMEKGQLPVVIGLWWIHGIFILLTWFLYHPHWFGWIGRYASRLPWMTK